MTLVLTGLPVDVLVRVLSDVEDPHDLRAVLRTSKDMLRTASDPVLVASWLLKHRQPSEHALALAASKGRSDVVLILLLNAGVSATARTARGPSPLELACRYGLPDVVRNLWSRRDVRQDVESASSALVDAAQNGHVTCMRPLLTHPSPLTADSRERRAGMRPLHEAASHAHAEAVQFLLAHGASCAARAGKGNGRTALQEACFDDRRGKEEERVRIVRMLLEAPGGMHVIDTPAEDLLGWTPLHFAAGTGLYRCCEVLLKSGSMAANTRDYDGRTPYLITYINERHVHAVLLRYGARVAYDDERFD